MSRARSACFTLDTDHPKIIGLGRSKYLAAPLSFLTQSSWATAKPPTSRARSCARRQRGAEAAGRGGSSRQRRRGFRFHQKRGGYLSFFLYLRLGAIARAAGRVRPVKPTAAGARRAITIQRAAPTTLPRRGIRRAHAAPWRLGRGNAEAA